MEGTGDGSTTGKPLGATLGFKLGTAVGSTVGSDVGAHVGFSDGRLVGDAVGFPPVQTTMKLSNATLSAPKMKVTEVTRCPADVLDPSQPMKITLPKSELVIVNVDVCPLTNCTIAVAFNPIVAQSRPIKPKPCTALENVN